MSCCPDLARASATVFSRPMPCSGMAVCMAPRHGIRWCSQHDGGVPTVVGYPGVTDSGGALWGPRRQAVSGVDLGVKGTQKFPRTNLRALRAAVHSAHEAPDVPLAQAACLVQADQLRELRGLWRWGLKGPSSLWPHRSGPAECETAGTCRRPLSVSLRQVHLSQLDPVSPFRIRPLRSVSVLPMCVSPCLAPTSRPHNLSPACTCPRQWPSPVLL